MMGRLPALMRTMDLARWRYAKGQGWQPHSHDFYELFWVEHGILCHQREDLVEDLGPGELSWLQPDDHHVGTAPDDVGVIFINVSVSREAVINLRQQYPREFILWDPARPRRNRLSGAALRSLAALIADLDSDSPADRDLLLLRLSHALRAASGPDLTVLPEWLRQGLALLDAEQAWPEGVSGLARRCRRSREHCNRTVQSCLGMTVTALLQRIRIHAAARLLVVDDLPIVAVAYATGFASIAHFYKLFRALCGETPQSFRAKRRGLGQAGPDSRTYASHGGAGP